MNASVFKITARTVLELGSELISSDIIAFYELIKNGFDAGTTSGVEIRFDVAMRRNTYLRLMEKVAAATIDIEALRKEAHDALNPDASEPLLDAARKQLLQVKSKAGLIAAIRQIYDAGSVTVSDTGSGMSVQQLADNFLVIGTASRKREVEKALARGDVKTPFLGEKGIGRLSAMRLGDHLRVETATRQDSKINLLEIDWSEFSKLDAMLDDIDVKPTVGGAKPKADWSGTRIVISALTEDWTKPRLKEMAEYDFARLADPFLDQKSRPRVVLFWNSDRLSIPWMSRRLIEHAHARVEGSYEIEKGVPHLHCTLEAIDLGYEHPKETETPTVQLPDLQSAVIGTSGDLPDSALVTVGPFKFEVYWFNRRRLGEIEGIGEMKVVRELQERWSGILLFRDGFRVFPYGEDEDDWLALDRKALRRQGYSLNKTQFIGRVEISRVANPSLVDQTNREGLRETQEQQAFLRIMQYVIQEQLFRFMRRMDSQYKGQKVDLSEAKSEIDRLETRANGAVRRLRKLTPPEGHEAIEELQQTLLEFSEFAERARRRIEEVEQESRQMVEMAGIGLMVEVVAHELARASENALINLEGMRSKKVPDDIRLKLESLRAEMKSLSKRVRVLDPLSVSGRQRVETFDLDELIRDTVEAHRAQFERQKIAVKLDLPKKPVRVRAVKGMAVQILENLISNSKYWLEMRSTREKTFRPVISISAHGNPPTIIYEDNGTGIAPENRDKVFQPFFSLKEKSKRRGLGLFIARECAEYNDGTLVLENRKDPSTGRLHRFTFELPATTSVK
jgi:signal transduction histidine kinase